MLESFFESIAWPMEPPPAYGAFHILFTLIGFALCGFSAWKLRKISDKAAGRLLFLCGLVLSLSEVFKQLFCYYVISDNTYHWGEFPFQLCSVPMYLCLIAPRLKSGKAQRALYSFMVLYNLLGGAISFAEPSGLLHGHVFLTAHSCLWHMLLVFVGLFLCLSGRGGTRAADYAAATRIFLLLCGAAFALNCLVQFGLGQEMNMFFVGPGNSPIIVFKQLSEWLGWYVSTPIYIAAVCLGAYLLFMLIDRISNQKLPSIKSRQS